MTQSGYNADDEFPHSFQDDQEEDAPRAGTRVLLLDGEATPYDNKNNNAVDCNQVQIVASHSDSPLHSLETSV